ncbi:SIN3 family co-repressor Pst3 [Schizosaccharomyces cryophilus OY26]|uniref:SIN3 family co-repressor Pst3 n=1 Tax=Schizosaccharomyces cryophilus (strain OY26 / ATCC MYA-4695 / CBS 11777 / NBRC 106824 / NRRL Y48691) TaxID=653667 RepID=S9X6K9_SCHCR|nr:SIN3 family co-repressor Pst3 [Schizosaccharomyces cryophilus OY26]EPY49396.1 SIN3 family co-repressor Pst3 [Schizosaccharomyces cryophilus OY26]
MNTLKESTDTERNHIETENEPRRKNVNPSNTPDGQSTSAGTGHSLDPAQSNQTYMQQGTFDVSSNNKKRQFDDYQKEQAIAFTKPSSIPTLSANMETDEGLAAMTSSNSRPLDVNDALSYLEMVRYYFSEKREVYNQFLEIMRDFKSQSLDTLGVINRVASLFNGYPQLIEGFNTFLPSGYKIEVHTDSSNTSFVRIGTPMHPLHPGTNTSSTFTPSTHFVEIQQPAIPDNQYEKQSPSSSENVSALPPKPQVDFNYAIAYMNKVKARYPPNSETYMEFLGVLRTYQKAQKSIHEVRARVSEIFSDSPDLLDEFKLFLPDTSEATEAQQNDAATTTNGLPPVGNFTLPSSGQSRERRLRPAHSAQIGRSISKTSKNLREHADELPSTYAIPNYQQKTSPVSHYAATQEELLAFGSIRQHLPDNISFHNFLELLHLYREKLMDKTDLLNSFSRLVKNDNLTLWFANFIRWNDSPILVKNIPMDDSRYISETYESAGYLYRKIPAEKQKGTCSGRDALANSVLNDEYILVAPKLTGIKNVKHSENQYLQALQLVEDERYEYDRILSVNQRAIKLLAELCEPVNDEEHIRSLNKTLDRKALIRSAFHTVYGKEHSTTAFDALVKNSRRAAPVLLKRLKLKDQEWRRCKREWNKIWRQIELKNSSLALDERCCKIEGKDRRALSYNRILNEIDDIYQHQKHGIGHVKQGFQFSQVLNDRQIFLNILRLSDAQLSNSSFYSYADKGRISAVLKALLSQFFGIPLPRETLESDLSSENIESVQKHRDGLSKIFVHPESADNSNTTHMSIQTDDTQTEDETMSDSNPIDPDTQTKMKLQGEESKNIIGYNFFGNATMYVLFRLICVSYSRLEQIKMFIETSSSVEPITYDTILETCEKYLKGILSRSEFHKYLQKLNNDACYMISSIERLLKVIFYRVHEILLDPKLGQLLLLFESDGAHSATTAREQMIYRNHVETILAPDTRIFNMRWYPLEKKLCIQQLLSADLTIHKFEDPARAFMYYVDSYAISHITEGVDLLQVKMPFLKRSLQLISQKGYLAGRESTSLHSLFNERFCKSNLQLFFSTDTYMIFFESNTENVYINSYNLWVGQSSKRRNQRRMARWQKWLEQQLAKNTTQEIPSANNQSATLDQVLLSLSS